MEAHSKKDSWISIRSLKEAADIHSVLKQKSRSSSASSNSENISPESSITMEWKPNTYVNQSVNFNSIRDAYCETIDSVQDEDFEAMSQYLHRREHKLRQKERKRLLETETLTKELHKTKEESAFLKQEIELLNAQFLKIQSQHDEEIHAMQAQMQRNRNEIELITEQKTCFLTEKLQEEFAQEMLRIRNEYESQIEDIKVEHELEIQEREEEWERFLIDERKKFEDNQKNLLKKIEKFERDAKRGSASRLDLQFIRDNDKDEEIERLSKLVAGLREQLNCKNQTIEEFYTLQHAGKESIRSVIGEIK